MTLAEKLVAVAKELDAISKDKQHPHYKYVSAEAFIKAARVPLMAQGVAIIPSDFKCEWIPQQSPNGKPGVAAHLHAGYTITDGKETIQASCIGEGWDGTGDKASYKAMTGCHKYLLRILFNIPMVDDPEGSGQGYTPSGGSQGAPAGRQAPSGGAPSTGAGSSEAQQKCIFAKAKGLFKVPAEFDGWMDWMKAEYQIGHTKELTKAQAKKVIDGLVEIEEEQKS